jgi:ferredoxin
VGPLAPTAAYFNNLSFENKRNHEICTECRHSGIHNDMKIVADTEKCVGSGQCVLTEPKLFDQNDNDSRVLILNDSPEDALAEKAKEAARVCPSRALSFKE